MNCRREATAPNAARSSPCRGPLPGGCQPRPVGGPVVSTSPARRLSTGNRSLSDYAVAAAPELRLVMSQDALAVQPWRDEAWPPMAPLPPPVAKRDRNPARRTRRRREPEATMPEIHVWRVQCRPPLGCAQRPSPKSGSMDRPTFSRAANAARRQAGLSPMCPRNKHPDDGHPRRAQE